jgi:hypothetical protein
MEKVEKIFFWSKKSKKKFWEHKSNFLKNQNAIRKSPPFFFGFWKIIAKKHDGRSLRGAPGGPQSIAFLHVPCKNAC